MFGQQRHGMRVVVLHRQHRPSVRDSAGPRGGGLRTGHGHRDRQRRVPAGTAQRQLKALIVDGDHRVLARHMDRPVVAQHRIGQTGDPIQILLAVDDRRAALVGRGHHQRDGPESVEQQMVHRRVGQHHAEVGQSWRHRIADGSTSSGYQHDGCRRIGQHDCSRVIDVSDQSSGVEIGHHHRIRLCGPVFSITQRCHRSCVIGSARQVITANTLDRNYFLGQQSIRHGLDRPRQPGSAIRTRDRLGVKATINRIVILPRTGRTHRKVRHRQGGPVVGQIGDDGVTRSAVGARNERTAETAVGRVSHLAQAIRTGRNIRRHQRSRGIDGLALDDLEARVAAVLHSGDGQSVDTCHRRRPML